MTPFKRCEIFIFYYFLQLVVTHAAFVNDMYSLTVNRWSCEDSDPRLVYNVTCFTKLESRTVRSHYLFLYMLPNVTLNQIFLRISGYKKINTVYRPFLINAEENFCGFLRRTAKGVLTEVVWSLLLKTSNLGHPCPFSGFANITRLILNEASFPPVLPEGQFRLNVHVRNGIQRMSVVNVNLFINIKPKGAANLNF